MTPWPKPWVGIQPMVAWMNRFLRRCQEEVFLESKDFRRVQTAGGYFIEAKAQAAKPGKGAAPQNKKLLAVTGLGTGLTPPIPDLLICSTYTIPPKGNAGQGATSNDTIYVAKQLDMRTDSSSEFFTDNGDNVRQTYTYFTKTSIDASYGDNFRMANDGTNSELQVVDPRYITKAMLPGNVPVKQCLIYAQETGAPTGVLDPNGNPVTMIEDDVREWGRYATQ